MALNGPMKLSVTSVPCPDDGRAAHMAADQASAGFDHDPAVELAFGVNLPVNAPLDAFQEQAVGLEQRGELPGVDPPPAQDLGQDNVAQRRSATGWRR